MTHADLVPRAVAWLRRAKRCSIVFSEMTTGSTEVPDAIGWRMGRSTVVEVKVSRGDFHNEKTRKLTSRFADCGMGFQRYYMVPEGLLTPEEIPEWWGLVYALPKRKYEMVKEAPFREKYDHVSELQMLMSAHSRHLSGVQYHTKTGRWDPVIKLNWDKESP